MRVSHAELRNMQFYSPLVKLIYKYYNLPAVFVYVYLYACVLYEAKQRVFSHRHIQSIIASVCNNDFQYDNVIRRGM